MVCASGDSLRPAKRANRVTGGGSGTYFSFFGGNSVATYLNSVGTRAGTSSYDQFAVLLHPILYTWRRFFFSSLLELNFWFRQIFKQVRA